MTGIIVYRSTYGSTKQYAEWIHEETGFALFDSRDRTIPWNADTIVLGCPIIASKPTLTGWIQKHWSRLEGKRVLLFTTSGADPAKEPVRDWIEKALPKKVRQGMAIFPLAGRFDFCEMSSLHKGMLRLATVLLRDEAIKHQIKHPVDGVSRANLGDLLAALRS